MALFVELLLFELLDVLVLFVFVLVFVLVRFWLLVWVWVWLLLRLVVWDWLLFPVGSAKALEVRRGEVRVVRIKISPIKGMRINRLTFTVFISP